MGKSYPGGYVERVTNGGAYIAHETAIIEADSRIGDGTIVQPLAIIRDGSVIGRNARIGSFVEVEAAIVGDEVELWNNSKVRIGADIGHGASIGLGSVVHARVRIGEGARVQSHASLPYGLTTEPYVFIGPGTKFTNDRHPRAIGSSGPSTFGPIELGFSCTVGAGATVVCAREGVRRVGEFSMLGAGAIATKEIRPYALILGREQVGWVNAAGGTISRDPSSVPPVEELVDGLEVELSKDQRLTEKQVQDIVDRANLVAQSLQAAR